MQGRELSSENMQRGNILNQREKRIVLQKNLMRQSNELFKRLKEGNEEDSTLDDSIRMGLWVS